MDGGVWDVVVVGAGIVGSWTAYHLCKHGYRVLLLEQFPLPHTRGSSHGLSRLIRMVHEEQEFAALMKDSYEQWRQLEAESGQLLIKTTQILVVDSSDNQIIKRSISSAKKYGHQYTYLSPEQLQQGYPTLRYPPEYHGLVDPEGGIIIPDKCLAALRTLIKKHGGQIQDGVRVQNIRPGYMTILETNKGLYRSKNTVLTTGPWSTELLTKLGLQLPIKPMAGMHAYWKLRDPSKHVADSSSSIVMGWVQQSPIYLFPSLEYPGMVKIGMRNKHSSVYCHPDKRDEKTRDGAVKEIGDYTREHFPWVESTRPTIIEPCMYTMTGDSLFVLDRHPHHQNIIIGTGFSGHGFKMSPAVGQLLCELTMNTTPSCDIKPFRISRFKRNHTSKL